jgi:type VI secretion system secreted protein VgrG
MTMQPTSSFHEAPLAAVASLIGEANLRVRFASATALDVRSFRVREAVSELFEIQLRVVAREHDLDFDELVGADASFEIRGRRRELDRDRRWTGVCRDLQQISAEPGGLSTYELSIVPVLWLLTQRKNYRIFQHRSELDIVRQILDEWGISPRLALSGSYPAREYRVQYAESDYAFVCRMLEDAGVSYFFEESDEGSRLVLSDAPQAAEPRAFAIPYRDEPTAADRDHVGKLALRRQMRPAKVTLRDHDTRLPADYPLLAGVSAASTSRESRLEQFEYAPGAFKCAGEADGSSPSADDRGASRSNEGLARELAARRVQALRGNALVASFETSANDLAPGVVFSITGHPRHDLDERRGLVVVRSTFEGEHDGAWSHRCEASFADAPLRPEPRTPRPKVNGVESATVVGPAGDEIHVDEFGRVRVHFHWDRESRRDEKSSCWIPVSQSWGGAGYGGTNLPRIGQEVVIDFLGGDPDQPIVVGRIYTNQQKTPYKLPDNKTQSGWKSCSTNQTGGYNEIMFEDLAGQELLRMQAEKDLDKLVKNDERVVIGHDRTKLVKHDDQLRVEHDRRKRIDHDETISIGHDRKELVENDERIKIGKNRTEKVGSNESITIGKNRTKKVKKNEIEAVAISRSRMVGVNEAVLVGVAQQIKVGVRQNVDIGSQQSIKVGKNQSTKVGSTQSIDVGKVQTVKVGKAATETIGLAKTLNVGVAYQIGVGGVMSTTVGKSQSEQVGTTKSVTAGESITLTCGKASITMEAAGTITLAIEGGSSVVLADKNATVTAPSGGVVVIQGGPEVHLNP